MRFTEAATVFFDPLAEFECDSGHSDEEQRYTVMSHSVRHQTLFVVHIARAKRIRIVSARKATARESREYEIRLGSMKSDWEDEYELPDEIDLTKGKWVKNPFLQDFRELNLVSLDADVKAVFPDSPSVMPHCGA